MTLGVVTDQTGTITVGTGKAVSITTAGQNALLTFAGTSGRAYAYTVTGSTVTSASITLVRPDGSDFSSVSIGTGASSGTFPALDSGGTWTLRVDPSLDATGSMTVKLS